MVGLYLNPPEKAVVLCVDEKSQIQALDRTQPLLPLRPGLPERCTHDYRAVEFRKFLAVIDKAMPPDVEVHLVLDNYSTRKTELIHKWLLKHPRYHFHFTPTSASWINQVERWFAEITRQQIRRGTYRSIRDLEAAIKEYIAAYNENPKPFIWTKSADSILESLKCYCTRIPSAGH